MCLKLYPNCQMVVPCSTVIHRSFVFCDPNGFREFMNKSGTFQSSSDAKKQKNVINET